jgi:hypothetical protein
MGGRIWVSERGEWVVWAWSVGRSGQHDIPPSPPVFPSRKIGSRNRNFKIPLQISMIHPRPASWTGPLSRSLTSASRLPSTLPCTRSPITPGLVVAGTGFAEKCRGGAALRCLDILPTRACLGRSSVACPPGRPPAHPLAARRVGGRVWGVEGGRARPVRPS